MITSAASGITGFSSIGISPIGFSMELLHISKDLRNSGTTPVSRYFSKSSLMRRGGRWDLIPSLGMRRMKE